MALVFTVPTKGGHERTSTNKPNLIINRPSYHPMWGSSPIIKSHELHEKIPKEMTEPQQRKIDVINEILPLHKY